jgi:hypothetical protein
MNDFEKRYESFDNQKLLKIVENAENYQSTAVEAAKLELSKREISEDEIQSFKNEISAKKAELEVRQEQIKSIENKAKKIGTELFETVNLIPNKPQTIDRKINAIVIVFGLLAIFQIFSEFEMIQFMFADDSLGEWDFSMVFYFIPLLILPIGVFYFWKRNKIGWILMTIFLVYTIINAIAMCILLWDSVSEGFEELFPQANPIIYILIIAIFGATIWVFNQSEFRTKFQINKQTALITIGVSALITSIMLIIQTI